MAVPKGRPSLSRRKMRRASNSKLTLPQLRPCPQCDVPSLPHQACSACGFYNGRQVVTVESFA